MKQKINFEKNFWVAIIMEFFERGAYYSVLSILSIYLTSESGLGFSIKQAGTIMGTIQPIIYFLPIIAGAIADRYGYRRILFFAFTCISGGYFLTAITDSYLYVFASLIIMAIGAGFFKPIISGTIAKTTNEQNSTLGFGVFYWSINLGAFLFPLLLVPTLKKFGYEYIFLMAACVGIIMLLINLFIYKEPKQHISNTTKSIENVFVEMVSVLKDSKFIILIVLYSFFWILYFQMYGTVLWYLKDHIDMTPINNAVNSLLSFFVSNPQWKFDTEHVTVINAGTIITLQILISKILQKTPALPTMIFGISLGTLGMFVLSMSNSPWIFIFGIMIFTLGEMTAHPKFMSYIGIISPPEKKALYMGYSFLYGVIGSFVGSFLGANLYEKIIVQMNKPKLLWLIFTIIGISSIIGLMIYNKIVNNKNKMLI